MTSKDYQIAKRQNKLLVPSTNETIKLKYDFKKSFPLDQFVDPGQELSVFGIKVAMKHFGLVKKNEKFSVQKGSTLRSVKVPFTEDYTLIDSEIISLTQKEVKCGFEKVEDVYEIYCYTDWVVSIVFSALNPDASDIVIVAEPKISKLDLTAPNLKIYRAGERGSYEFTFDGNAVVEDWNFVLEIACTTGIGTPKDVPDTIEDVTEN